MIYILVRLNPDRDRCGDLVLIGDAGRRILGPFPVAARASSEAARRHGNPSRAQRLRYGDAPTGGYRVAGIAPTGPGTPLEAEAYGRVGVIVLDPTDGEAALAEANGRFRLLIQGGGRAPDGRLKSTGGGFRLADEHLAALIAALGGGARLRCLCVEDPAAGSGAPVFDDPDCEEHDPAPVEVERPGRAGGYSRRTMLQVGGGTAATGLIPLNTAVFFASGATPAAAAPLAYGNPPAPVDFVLTIARKFSSKDCTSGYLAVNGQVIAYTLELPWRGNAPVISSIPTGTYSGILRYDHADHWRIELVGVPGNRKNIQIHTGNTTDDTEGCIIVGTGMNPDLCSLQGGSSKQAYDALRTAFYGTPNPVSTPNKNIRIIVED